MNKQANDKGLQEDVTDDNTDETTDAGTPTQTSASSKPSTDGIPEGYVTEESYKSSQRIIAKKDKELVDLKDKLTTLSDQLEELKSNTNSLSGTKDALEKQVEDARQQAESLQSERDKLNQQLERQGIIMQEFPSLAPLAQYIPSAADADAFRENAKQFSEAMKSFVDQGVQTVIAGSTSPQTNSDDTVSETEEDRLWRDVYSLAGVPGKEKEYGEANRRLQEVLATKNT